MAFIESNDNVFYYEVHGEGEPVVLAHGLGGNHATWFKQVATLSKAYKVITFDHRGFGNSTDNNKLGRGGFVQDLKSLLDHLDIEKAAFVGQSMGAGTVISFACQYPKRVSGLVIADSLHAIEESGEVVTLMDKARTVTKDLSQLERVLGESFKRDNPIETVLYQQINSFNDTDRSNLTGAYANTSYTTSQLADLEGPILFVAGQEDILFPIEAIRLVQQKVEGSFIVELDACGHSAFFEKPVEFNDTVLSFLQLCGLEPTSDKALSNSAGYEKI